MDNKKALTKKQDTELSNELITALKKEIVNVRDDVRENPYIDEALNALSAGNFRSTIGSYWNAVEDDLRNKIMHRSLDLFNKEMKPRKTISKYEDFQDHVTANELIDGAYKIGVIGWESRKLLHQARETRNIFDGHPNSEYPSLLKVLNMINDCNKYVLAEDYPVSIINISEYMPLLDSTEFDKNEIAVEQAFTDLPEVYKTELIHRFYESYVHESASLNLRANIEFCAPILWSVLNKDIRMQIGKKFDKEFVSGNKDRIQRAVDFIILFNGLRYVGKSSRKGIFKPAINNLLGALDDFHKEAQAVRYLSRLGTYVPDDLLDDYVKGLTLVYVGRKGSSTRFARTDFYSDAAVPVVMKLFKKFDDNATEAFINTVRNDEILRRRIVFPEKLTRVRTLGNILLNRTNLREDLQDFLEILVDEAQTTVLMTKHLKLRV